MTSESTSNTRTVTVEVPEDRVEQFQALAERFLSSEGFRRGRGHRRGPGGRRARHLRRAMYHLAMAQHSGEEGGHGCARRRHEKSAPAESEAPVDPTTIATV